VDVEELVDSWVTGLAKEFHCVEAGIDAACIGRSPILEIRPHSIIPRRVDDVDWVSTVWKAIVVTRAAESKLSQRSSGRTVDGI
jgi:hypothetical protein